MNNILVDKFGRSYKYLRVSVTDRCNFRCKYCQPSHDFDMLSHQDILRYEELLFTIETFAELGVNKIRVTGGEPLVRKNISYFLKQIKDLKGINEVTLTTNGSLLDRFAKNIYEAGITRINVSIDSLKEDRYSYITGGFDLNQIIKSLEIAKSVGLNPIKINTVAIKGFNDDEIIDFCEFAAKNNLNVRFIEFMPIGNSIEWKKDNIITGSDILNIISKHYSMSKVERKTGEGPAENYLLSNGAKIGIITPISNHFCGDCDKLRLTSDGKIRPCLLSDNEIDIKEIIRKKDKSLLKQALKESLNLKEEKHNIDGDNKNEKFKRTMSKIGG
jgi:cyclic pyranopterin phosphate synthase